MQGASGGMNGTTTDYGSQTMTHDDTSHLVSSAVTVAVNPQLAAVAAMNGHATTPSSGQGTETPPPPCSTPPPTYEQAILGGACHATRRNGEFY